VSVANNVPMTLEHDSRVRNDKIAWNTQPCYLPCLNGSIDLRTKQLGRRCRRITFRKCCRTSMILRLTPDSGKAS
jgi:phage/plasmid-associated DNA primase